MKSRYACFSSQKICILYLKIQTFCHCLPIYLSIYFYARNFWLYRNEICFNLWTSKLKKTKERQCDTGIENIENYNCNLKNKYVLICTPTSNKSCFIGAIAYISYFLKFGHFDCKNRIIFDTISLLQCQMNLLFWKSYNQNKNNAYF